MKKSDSKNVTILSKEEEIVINAIAEKMSEQISQLMVASLGEILVLIKENGVRLNVQPASRPDEFLTAIEIAEILKISKAQAYQMIRTRVIPSFSIGKTVRVKRDDLDAFIQSHMVR